LVWSLSFVPLDPLSPLLNYFFSIKLSSNAKSRHSENVCVKILPLWNFILFSKNFNYLFLERLYLSQLAVGDFQWIAHKLN